MDAARVKGGWLLLSDQVTIPINTVLSVVNGGRREAVSEDDMLIITQAALLGGKLTIESESLDTIVCVSLTRQLIEEQWLEEMRRVLKPGGEILIPSPVPLPEQSNKARSTLERKLLTAGFLEIQAIETKEFLTIQGKKPLWALGSSFSIKKAKKAIPKIHIDDELDLIDEDSLLTEEDMRKPQLPPVGDCEVGTTRKACKNCTCGRAEAEEREVKILLTDEKINNPQSACGSCGLGDAFRCGTCPFKGLPPFQLGQKVSLPGSFLAADI